MGSGNVSHRRAPAFMIIASLSSKLYNKVLWWESLTFGGTSSISLKILYSGVGGFNCESFSHCERNASSLTVLMDDGDECKLQKPNLTSPERWYPPRLKQRLKISPLARLSCVRLPLEYSPIQLIETKVRLPQKKTQKATLSRL